MAFSLSELGKYINNEILVGVADSLSQVDPLIGQIPVEPIKGLTVHVNLEDTAGGVDYTAVDAQLSTNAKAASVVDPTYYTIKSIVGDAVVDGLTQAAGQAGGVDPMAIQIASKAKNIGRKHSQSLINGSFASGINSLKALTDASNAIDGGNTTLSLSLIRELMDAVRAKDGQVDFVAMPSRLFRALQALYDAEGGTSQIMTQAGAPKAPARDVMLFDGVWVFKNGYAQEETTAGLLANEAGWAAGAGVGSVYAGTFSSGHGAKDGIAFITPEGHPAGLEVKNVGELENFNATGMRVVHYTELASFNKNAVARAFNIKL